MKSVNYTNSLSIANINGETFIKSLTIKPSGEFLAIHIFKKAIIKGEETYVLTFPNDLSFNTVMELQNSTNFKSLTKEELEDFKEKRASMTSFFIEGSNKEEHIETKEYFDRILSLNKHTGDSWLVMYDTFLNKNGEIIVCPTLREVMPYIIARFYSDKKELVKDKIIQFSNNELALVFEKNDILYLIFLIIPLNSGETMDMANSSVSQVAGVFEVESSLNVIEEVAQTEYELSKEEILEKMNDLFEEFGFKIELK